MTVLFCDLVGFTASSEAADPEAPLSRRRSRPPSGRSRSPLSSPCPSRRALGYRGGARSALGERQGSRTCALALEHGQGRDAAVLHNNLAITSWLYEGPQAALAVCHEDVDFCERRASPSSRSGSPR